MTFISKWIKKGRIGSQAQPNANYYSASSDSNSECECCDQSDDQNDSEKSYIFDQDNNANESDVKIDQTIKSEVSLDMDLANNKVTSEAKEFQKKKMNEILHQKKKRKNLL